MRKDFLSGRPQEKVVVYSGDRYWLSALITIRINAPLTAAGYQIIQGNDSQGLMVTDLTGVDFVIVHRDFPRQINQYFHVLREARKHEIPIIYEIDDLLFDLPADHPERRNGYYTQGLVAMLLAARKADLVTTTTEQLANFLCPFNPNIRILPNYLDDSLWHMKPPKQAEPDQGKIVVGYIGGESHFPDLKMIVPALTALIEKYGSEIEFKFWGLQPPEELTANSQVEGFPPSE